MRTPPKSTEHGCALTLTLCPLEEPLECTKLVTKSETPSVIGETEVTVFQIGEQYLLRFSYRGLYGKMELSGLSGEELGQLMLALFWQ